MAIGDVTFYPNYIHYAGYDATAEPSASGETYTCSGGETSGALYDLLDNRRSSVVTFDSNGEASSPTIDFDTTNDVSLFSFVIIDNHNLDSANAGVEVQASTVKQAIDASYAGALESATELQSVGDNVVDCESDGVLLILLDDPPTDNDIQIVTRPPLGGYTADITIGEIAVGIAFSHDILAKGINAGYPVVMTFPEEGTGYEVGGLSLIKGGPEPELGKQFMDWCYTVEAQNLFQAYNRLPVNPKATVAEGSVTLEDVKLIDYDHILAGESKDEWVEAWRDRIGK